MVRGKNIFTVGSIVSMAIMLVTLMLGYVEDCYYEYYRYGFSFLVQCWEWYLVFLVAVILYIACGVAATALYKERIKAINIINLISTIVVYLFAMVVANVAIEYENLTFGLSLLFAAFGIAFPLHLAVDIVALATQKFKKVEQPDSVASVAPEAVSNNNDAIDALKELKDLCDKGILTEEEYIAKRQKYVSRL